MTKGVNIRKHLSANALINQLKNHFGKIEDTRRNNQKYSLSDTLMSGYAVFALKSPSLLAFDNKRKNLEELENIKSVFKVENVPCDSQMRNILDEVDPEKLRPAFTEIFAQLQRGKVLEKMTYFEDYYILSMDGSEVFSSENNFSDSCLSKKLRSGQIMYHQQMLGAAIVHPKRKEVIPLCPEMIIKQDGNDKNDCERNAAKRFLNKYRTEHPHLKTIVVEDALASNAPHINELKIHNCKFVLGVKPDGNKFLFDYVENALQEKSGKVVEYEIEEISTHNEKGQKRKKDKKILHKFRFMNGVPLNESNQDVKVNFMDYRQVEEGTETAHFSWIMDFEITKQNCIKLMRVGRARWRIENETFNTLKNQGYQLEHNFGLGKKYLSTIFILLTMLAFLVDQVQQLCSPLFQAALEKLGGKKYLWEEMRSLFHCFKFESMEILYRAILKGFVLKPPKFIDDTS